MTPPFQHVSWKSDEDLVLPFYVCLFVLPVNGAFWAVSRHIQGFLQHETSRYLWRYTIATLYPRSWDGKAQYPLFNYAKQPGVAFQSLVLNMYLFFFSLCQVINHCPSLIKYSQSSHEWNLELQCSLPSSSSATTERNYSASVPTILCYSLPLLCWALYCPWECSRPFLSLRYLSHIKTTLD